MKAKRHSHGHSTTIKTGKQMDTECVVDNLFHPVVARWFIDRIGRPTEIQAESWPNIARRSNVLITAPTGSGKTLAAFLWALDALYAAVRTSYPFRNLQRRAFDLVIDMLAGRYEATRIPALRPKIVVDRLDQTATARKGALLTLYTSGGVIPDRGYFKLRHLDTGARVGELDEEFVWEAQKGQVFTLGTQNWRIDRITHNDVFARPARPRTPAPPFWRAEDVDRDFHLADKIGCFLETADKRMNEPAFVDELAAQYQMGPPAARFLLGFLKRQKEKTGCPLPHRHHVLVERMSNGKGAAPVSQVAIHTFWGGWVNRPFGLALEVAWEKRYGVAPNDR